MEYARNVLGLREAQHAEYDPAAATLLIAPVACPVAGRPAGAPSLSGKLAVQVVPGSLAHRIYQRPEVAEEFFCNYEFNPAFQELLEAGGLRTTGRGAQGKARVVELPRHRFFLATLFLPQLASRPGRSHPLITEYLKAAAAFRDGTRGDTGRAEQ